MAVTQSSQQPGRWNSSPAGQQKHKRRWATSLLIADLEAWSHADAGPRGHFRKQEDTVKEGYFSPGEAHSSRSSRTPVPPCQEGILTAFPEGLGREPRGPTFLPYGDVRPKQALSSRKRSKSWVSPARGPSGQKQDNAASGILGRRVLLKKVC